MRPTRWSVLGVALAVLVPSVSAGASTTKITGNAAAISYFRASATAMTKVTHLVSVSSGVTYLGVTTIGGKVAFSLDYQTGHPGSSSEVPVNVSQYISASGNVIHWDLTVLASPCHGGALTCHSRVDRLVMLDLRGAHYWTLESNAETPPFSSALLPACWYRSSGGTAGLVSDFSSVGQQLGTIDFNGGAGTTLTFLPLKRSGTQEIVTAHEVAKGVSGTVQTWVDRSTKRWSRAFQSVTDTVGGVHHLSEEVVVHYAVGVIHQPAAKLCTG
ncbi:MAG: hypothetical protein KGR42_04355 [Acidobacteria bacterium]|nr:hypothetical protein [Acidobacteriota bacterium]